MKWLHPSAIAMGIVATALGVVGTILILRGVVLTGAGAIVGSVVVAMFGKAMTIDRDGPRTAGRIGPR